MNDKKEAFWFAVVAGIGMLFLIIFYESGRVMEAHTETGEGSIPGAFWVLIGVYLSLCALVPYLLRESEPVDFKISAILLTAVLPAVGIAFVVFNLWHLTHE